MAELKKLKLVVEIDPSLPEMGHVSPSEGMNISDTIVCMDMIVASIGRCVSSASNWAKEQMEMYLIQAVQRDFEEGAYGEVEEE